MSQEVISKLQTYKRQSLLKGAVLNILIKQISPKQNEVLIKQFEDADVDGSGSLDQDELE